MSFISDNFKDYCKKQVEKFVNGLQTSNEERIYKTACELQQYICNEMQTLNSNETTLFLEELCTKIFFCLNKNDQNERGLILAIIILVSVDVGNNKIICSRAANFLRNLEVVEVESMELIAYAIGKIAIASGSITDSYVDFEVSKAFENISEDSNESKKHLGILILQELAISTPNCFLKYIERFFDIIFNPIIKNQNQNKLIQKSSINALKAVLYIICKNETKEKQSQYFQICYKNAINVLEKLYSVKQNSKDKIIRDDRIQGALLILNELLRCADSDFEKLRNSLKDTIYQQNVFESPKSRYHVIREWGEISTNQSYRKFINSCSKVYLNNDLKPILEFHTKMSFVSNDLPPIRVLPSTDSLHFKKLVTIYFDKFIKYILREKESTNSGIQKSILMLIPRLSMYESFLINGYFDEAIQHTLDLNSKKFKERSSVLIALGFLTCVPKNYIKKYIPKIIQVLKSHLQNREIFSRKKNLSIEPSVIQCVSLIAQSSITSEIKDELRELIDPLLNSGLSPSLQTTLFMISEKIPELQKEIHEKLFQVLFLVLFRWKCVHTGDPKSRIIDTTNLSLPSNEANFDSQIIVLALKMLGHFNFSYKHAIQLFHYNIHNYILNIKEEICLEAVKTCFKLLNKLLKEFHLNFSLTLVSLIQNVLNQILLIATTNNNAKIRYQILASLNNNFDKFLTQPNHITRLFVCINDEVFEIRELAIFIIGRLSDLNPAFIKPKLRLLLIELLNNLENSNSQFYREQSTRMLSHIITTSPKFSSQYASTILDILTSILKDKRITNNYMIIILYTIGLQSRVSEEKINNYLDKLLPILLDIIQDSSYSFKREVGLWTLGQIVDVSGCVVDPYWKYKNLLDILLNIFRNEQSIYVRREATKVLGLLGAVDPYEHKIKIGIIDQSGSDYITDDTNQPETQESNNAETLVNMSSSLENFYLAIAVTNMLKIVKDPSLLIHHIAAIEGINFMFITFTSKCIPFIHQVFPLYLSLIKNSDHQIREAIFCQLCTLIPIVKDHIKEYLEQLFNFIKEYWETASHQISLITLVEQIAISLKTEFKQNLLPKILPDILKSFYNDKSNDKQVTSKLLSLMQKFDDNSHDFLNLILPEIIKIFENKDYPILVRKKALTVLKTLSDNLDLSNYYSMIMQPAIRIYHSKPAPNELKDALSELIYNLVNKYEIDKEIMEKLLSQNNIEFRKDPAYQDRDNEVYKSSRKTTRSNRVSTTKKPMMFTSTLEKAFSSNFSSDIQWNDYIKEIFNNLLNDTPSTALKACLNIFRSYEQLPKDVFNVAFFSCWIELNGDQHKKIIQDLEKILQNDKIPEMVTVILNLVEFMDHTEYSFPIDLNLLSETAVKHRVYAKALRFREKEFQKVQSCKVLESLISINNKLRQSSAVSGILKYAAKNHEIDFKVKEQWHEKLHNWENALKAYQQKRETNPSDIQSTIGQMRCLEMLGEWEDLYKLSLENWSKVGEEYQGKIARMCAAAAWSLNKWDDMEMYTEHIRHNTCDYPFYKAVLAIHKKDYQTAQSLIDHARDKIDSHLTAMVGESQDRAYGAMVSVMLFSELEEVIQYKTLIQKCDLIQKKWWDRLQGCQKIVEDWQKILRVHSLVLTQYQDRTAWLKFASICQKVGRLKLSQRILIMLIREDNSEIGIHLDKELNSHNIGLENPSKIFSILTDIKINNDSILYHINCPKIAYGFIKHLWRTNDHDRAYCFLQLFVFRLENKIAKLKKFEERKKSTNSFTEQVEVNTSDSEQSIKKLLSRCCSKISYWTEAISGLNEKSIKIMLTYFSTSVTYDSKWYKAWNSYALCNFKAISFYCNKLQVTNNNLEPDIKNENVKEIRINEYAIAAIKGFFKSISLSHGSSLQDTLRLLTILFDEGQDNEVAEAFIEGSKTVPIETWLQVIPQLIARIDTYRPLVCQITQQLLIDVSKRHPQALIYSLTVAQKSSVHSRQVAANKILKTMSEHSSNLVNQALLVSDELIRVSILWHELWHDGLEEASRLYFGDKNVIAMLEMLDPLHKHLERGPRTFKEMSFKNAFGLDLAQAKQYCKNFLATGDVKNVTQAWEFYYHVFKKISKQLPNLTTLELQYVSPKLLCCKNLELAVPGIYHPNKPVVKIARIESDLQVITSKQRPRKLCIKGSNGKDFMFLLKGHEDLRQDERVMQLFGLVNSILANSYETSRRNLAIQRYAVIPLSHNSGLIGWVPHCDTLHTLIKDYRDKNKTLLNIEHRIMLRIAPNFDRLTIMQKVEIFENALDSTQGDDIHCLLWNKSPTSEIWFERRTNYIRSLAVMSMVGYILGLGDRHPSNLMIDRLTGKVLHIDFGDCFEVAMAREKFPEKIPFRLTRMLIKAMEVTGIEGTYQITCEKVLKVLRNNKESLMAVLEAFVYDPLLNWGLTETTTNTYSKNSSVKSNNMYSNTDLIDSVANELDICSFTDHHEHPLQHEAVSTTFYRDLSNDTKFSNHERLNKKALAVVNRILDKLTGHDFDKNVCLSVPQQVELLIKQATSNENLCQLYIGWCPFW